MAEDPNVNNQTDPNNGGEPGGQTFTQADVDRIVGQRLARAQKDMPSADELNAYRSWKATQQSEADKLKDMTAERDKAKSDLDTANEKITQYEREKYLSGKGVSAEDLDYYLFKISKMVSDTKTFEAAADEFLKDKKNTHARVDMSGSLGGGNKKLTTNEMMNAIIRGKF